MYFKGKLSSALATVTLALFFAGGGLSCKDSSKRLIDAARQAMEVDDFEGAAHLYQEVAIRNPKGALAEKANFELAEIYYLRLRDVDSAKKALIQALSANNGKETRTSVRAALLLARLYKYEFGEPHSAMKLYRSLLKRDLENNAQRETLLELAYCHYQLGEFDTVVELYRKALSLPYHRDADAVYMRLANLERLAGSKRESVRLLREFIQNTEDENNQLKALLKEVQILSDEGRFGEAERRISLAEEENPTSSELKQLRRELKGIQFARQEIEGLYGETLFHEQQKKLRWDYGRTPRSARRD